MDKDDVPKLHETSQSRGEFDANIGVTAHAEREREGASRQVPTMPALEGFRTFLGRKPAVRRFRRSKSRTFGIIGGTFADSVGRILRRIYGQLPSGLQRRLRPVVKELLKSKSRAVRSVLFGSLRVKELDDKLWGGFSKHALVDLDIIKNDAARPIRDRVDACYSLARWFATEGNFAAALAEMEDRIRIDPKQALRTRQTMLQALFLCRLGRASEARMLIERLPDSKPFNVSTELMLANTCNPAVAGEHSHGSDAQVLGHVNKIFRHFGLSEVEKRVPDAPLSLDNVRGRNVKRKYDFRCKVTIIVPAYNAEKTIMTALLSLSEQSWQNIEVLVVDDCSSDDTAAVVESFCATDPRFALIRQAENGGSYVCRNRALKEATGHYVTIHDADDWAHPDRISAHVREAYRKKTDYSVSKWVRTLPDLFFVGVWRPQEELTNLNMGSLFVHRAVFDEIGDWDEVRISGDREFLNRLERFGKGRRRIPVAAGCPLVFGRVAPTSLTQASATSVATVYHGVRREYHEATDYAHHRQSRLLRNSGRPVIVAPRTIRGKFRKLSVDALFIADWNMRGGTFHSAKNMILSSLSEGLSVSALHYPRYQYGVADPIRREVREFFEGHGIEILSPGEAISATTVVCTYPAIFEYKMDRFPAVEFSRVVVVINQMAERDTVRRDAAYSPRTVRQNLVDYFGVEGDWVPISNYVRKLMIEDERYPRPHQDTWTPMIDVETWLKQGNSAHWRGDERKVPVIGRHGRDHELKWPGQRANLLAAYCGDKDCEVRFLGGASRAKAILGQFPSNWFIEPFGSRDVKDFLADLDFFVHYPHEDYIEEFGRAPMEAMAAGVPVILPPTFRVTFSQAALYADAAEVWSTVAMLWQDRDAYEARVEAGYKFVRENCSLGQMRRRLYVPSGPPSGTHTGSS